MSATVLGLQPITDERLHHSTTNTEDGACVNIKAQGFWNIDSVLSLTLGSSIPSHTPIVLSPSPIATKDKKKSAYDQRIREVEHGCFSLVFSVSGGGVYKKLALMIAAKHNQPWPYSQLASLQAQILPTSFLNRMHKGVMFLSKPAILNYPK